MTEKSERSSDFLFSRGVNKSPLTTVLVDILYLQYLKKVVVFFLLININSDGRPPASHYRSRRLRAGIRSALFVCNKMSQEIPNLLYLNEYNELNEIDEWDEDDEKAETAGVEEEDEEELEYDEEEY